MKKVTLVNEFHNSNSKVIPRADGTISSSTWRRVRRELCGIAACCCGVVRGGSYGLEPLPDGTNLVIEVGGNHESR